MRSREGGAEREGEVCEEQGGRSRERRGGVGGAGREEQREKGRCGRSREGGAEREGEVWEEQGGRSRERSRKESGEGGAERGRREIERHFQWDVCVQ